jgi:ABC-type polysaccharide/polyol phosphate transport system ATPase subunit
MDSSERQSADAVGTIRITDLVLEYPIYRHLVWDRARALLGAVIRPIRPTAKRVLERVSFVIQPGEVVGIVGRNGSGKTSLLKTIAGATYPDGGRVEVSGRTLALFAAGLGFRPQFTGRENVKYGGLLLGFRRKQIDALLDVVAQFSELGEALDQPFFTYSSGMRSRLAFSLAISTPSDIVILDETLATGDSRFVTKCYRQINEMRKSGKTIVLVSHNLGEVARLTSRVLVLDQGRLIFDGDVFEGITCYERLLLADSVSGPPAGIEEKDIQILLTLKDESGRLLQMAEIGQRLAIELKIDSRQDWGECFVFLRLISTESNRVYAYVMPKRWDTLRTMAPGRDSVEIGKGETTIAWTIQSWTGGEGGYFFDVYIGPPCDPEAPDLSGGRFWRHAANFMSVYGNAYLKGACSVTELPVESVRITRTDGIGGRP